MPGLGLAAEVESETAASVKAHLADGSVLLFPDGLRMHRSGEQRSLEGGGRSLALPDVFALEFYNDRLPLASLRQAADLAGPVSVEAWRSSPSLYSFDGKNFVLEAEAFSSNILAAAEADDLDRLESGVAAEGRYRLRVSNQAWETQYINALRMQAVDHAENVDVYPTRARQLVQVGPLAPIDGIRSRDGRCVSKLLSAPDGDFYQTAPEVARALTQRITRDWVEFEVRAPSGVRHFFVVMRVRNTQLSNVLLEDALLAGRGLETLDLLGGEGFRILEKWRLYRWVRRHMGMRLLVERGGKFRSVDRVGATGPSAWRDVVIKVPARGDDPIRARLSFLADSWHIDSVAVSFEGSDRVRSIKFPVRTLHDGQGTPLSIEPLRSDDREYFALYPGQSIEATFDVTPPPAGLRRTYFAETHGYFIKWLAPELLAGANRSFAPSNEDVFRAAQRWLTQSGLDEPTEPTNAPH